MKITKITATALALRDQPLLNCSGVHPTHATRTLVQIETDDGYTGAGEAGGNHVDKIEQNRWWLDGADCLNITRARRNWNGSTSTKSDGWAAVETAMLDAAAKKANLPLCDYIGGRVRDKVEFAAYLFYKMADENGRGEIATGDTLTPEQFVEQAEAFVSKYGFKELKIKGGFFHPDVDIETFRLLRQRFPKSDGYEIRIDPNANWNVDTAIRVVKEIEQYEPQYLEDLCGPLEQNYELKKHTDVPTASNMCVSAFGHVGPNVRQRGIDVILGDHHHWGGILSYVETGVLCRVFGFGLSGHSNNSFGVSQAAMVHAYAATPELAYAADSHYPWTDPDGDIIEGPKLQFKDGFMAVPDAPGLGVEVDQDKVDEYAEIYRSGAIHGRVEMVKSLDPLWPWGRPRW